MAKVVSFGEVMMRLSPPGNARFSQASQFGIVYGGGEANMTLSLAVLGIDAKHVTVFPANDLGRAATAYLKKHGLDMEVHYEGDRLGLYFLETGAASRASRIVYDRYNSAFANLKPEWFNWEEILAGADYFLFTGITPAVSAAAYNACLDAVVAAKKLGVTVFGDVNYRRNLWKYGTTVQQAMPALVQHCDIIVCGENDADDIFGIKPSAGADNSFVSVAKGLQQQFPNIKRMISTKRTSISASQNALVGISTDGNDYIETGSLPIDFIVDRIGSGDAFAAGYVFGRIHYGDEEKAVKFGTAAAVLKHTIEGDSNLASFEEIETVMNGDFSARLLR